MNLFKQISIVTVLAAISFSSYAGHYCTGDKGDLSFTIEFENELADSEVYVRVTVDHWLYGPSSIMDERTISLVGSADAGNLDLTFTDNPVNYKRYTLLSLEAFATDGDAEKLEGELGYLKGRRSESMPINCWVTE